MCDVGKETNLLAPAQSRTLEETNAILASIVENSNDAIIGKTLDGIITTWNAGAQRIFGYTPQEAIGKCITMLIPRDQQDEEMRILARLRRDERMDHYQTIRIAKSGKPIQVSLTISCIKDSHGNIIGISKIARDITSQKLAEAELTRAKENAEAANLAKDHFLAVVSHELRTPLTPVLAGLTLLERNPDLPPSVLAELSSMRANVELEAKLINDLLELTRLRRGKIDLHFEVTDAHKLIHNVLDTCRTEIEAKSLEISLSLHGRQHQVWADPIRFQQILWNLTRNAAKFTPAGGRISLHTSNDSQGRLCIDITDTGIGIDPAILPRLFTPFDQGDQSITRKYGGLGLGLSIARMLMELHHGTLTARSEGKDRGATFTLTLNTISEPAAAAPSPPVTRPAVNTHACRILLVEDHPDTLRLMTKILASLGYCVKTSNCVHYALEVAARENFDVLVSDIGLPDGSGLDIMRQIKSQHPIRGIALSGFGTPEDIRKSREAGFATHLVKPVSIAVLEGALHEVSC